MITCLSNLFKLDNMMFIKKQLIQTTKTCLKNMFLQTSCNLKVLYSEYYMKHKNHLIFFLENEGKIKY